MLLRKSSSTFPKMLWTEWTAAWSESPVSFPYFWSISSLPTRPCPLSTFRRIELSDVSVAVRLLPSRSLSSLSVVRAPRNPFPCSVRARMFFRDRAMPERSARRSPPPSSSFSMPAPGAGGMAPPISTSGSSAVPPSSSTYLSPSRPIVLMAARVPLRRRGAARRSTSYTTRTVRSAGSGERMTSSTLPTVTPFNRTGLPATRPDAESKRVSYGNFLRKRFARWPTMKIPTITAMSAIRTTIPTRNRLPT